MGDGQLGSDQDVFLQSCNDSIYAWPPCMGNHVPKAGYSKEIAVYSSVQIKIIQLCAAAIISAAAVQECQTISKPVAYNEHVP